jgi:hypothetical protein
MDIDTDIMQKYEKGDEKQGRCKRKGKKAERKKKLERIYCINYQLIMGGREINFEDVEGEIGFETKIKTLSVTRGNTVFFPRGPCYNVIGVCQH